MSLNLKTWWDGCHAVASGVRLLAFLLSVLFVSVIGVIRAQPYTDQDIHTLITPPEGCIKPCWQGIRPGETSALEALMILREHQWVGRIENQYYYSYERGSLHWDWSLQHPALVKPHVPSSAWYDNSTIQDLGFWSRISYGDMILALGQPDKLTVHRSTGRLKIDSLYYDERFLVTFELSCLTSRQKFWFAETTLRWVHEFPENSDRVINSPHEAFDCG